jgi:hypothetical protein
MRAAEPKTVRKIPASKSSPPEIETGPRCPAKGAKGPFPRRRGTIDLTITRPRPAAISRRGLSQRRAASFPFTNWISATARAVSTPAVNPSPGRSWPKIMWTKETKSARGRTETAARVRREVLGFLWIFPTGGEQGADREGHDGENGDFHQRVPSTKLHHDRADEVGGSGQGFCLGAHERFNEGQSRTFRQGPPG